MMTNMHYELYGKGIPIVCIHGFPLAHTIWSPWIPFIEDRARIITPDLRGYGRSDCTEYPASMNEMAEDILELIEFLELSQVCLVGQSMGGYVALHFARLYPERVNGLMLVASHPYADSQQTRENRMQMIEKVRTVGVKETLKTFPEKLSTDASVQEYALQIIDKVGVESVVASQMAMAGRVDNTDILRNAGFPTAIVVGDQDQFVNAAMQEKMRADLPNTDFMVIPDVGHMLMMEAPEKLTASVVTLIEKIKE